MFTLYVKIHGRDGDDTFTFNRQATGRDRLVISSLDRGDEQPHYPTREAAQADLALAKQAALLRTTHRWIYGVWVEPTVYAGM